VKGGRGATARAADAAVVIALVAAALLFWKLRILDPAEPGPFEPSPGQGDVFTYTYPMAVGASRAIRAGEIPLWNPFQASGHPLLAAVAGGALYPLNFSYVLFPAQPHVAIEMTLILHLVLAGVFTYFYGRALSLRPLGASAAAIAYAFSGFVSTEAVWFLPSLSACVWLPLGLLAIERIFERRRFVWALVLGAAVAMPILAGWLQTWVYSMYAIALYASLQLLGRAWRRAPAAELGGIALLVAGGVLLGLALAAIQLLPSHELRSLSPYQAGGLSQARILHYGAMPPTKFLSQALDPSLGIGRWNYLGMVPLLLIPLSLLAVFCSSSSSSSYLSSFLRLRVLYFWCLVTLSLGVIFSLHTPAFAMLLQVPTASWFRMPQRIVFLYAFAGSMLTGIAVHWLSPVEGRRPGWPLGVKVLIVGLVAGLAALLSFGSSIAISRSSPIPTPMLNPTPNPIPTPMLNPTPNPIATPMLNPTPNPIPAPMLNPTPNPIPGRGLVYLWLGAGAICCAAWLRFPRVRRLTLAGLVGVLAWDSFHATENSLKRPYQVPGLLDEGREVFDYVKRRQGFDRTYIRGAVFDFALMPKRGTLEEVYSIGDYEPLSLKRRGQFLRRLEGRDEAPSGTSDFVGFFDADASSPGFRVMMDLMSVRYAISRVTDRGFRAALLAREPPWRKVFRPPGVMFAVFENPAPLPRAYVAADAVPVASGREALDAIARSSFDPRRSVVIEGLGAVLERERSDPTAAPPITRARIRSYRASEVVVEANAARDGYLVLTDTFYPGWKVSVDGRPGRIYPANYLFRAVPLEAGHHRVRFRYDPPAFKIGAAVTLMSLCGIAIYASFRLVGGRRCGRAQSSSDLVSSDG
jgi:hypothetical protein